MAMHSYSIDSESRLKVSVVLFTIATAIPGIFNSIVDAAKVKLNLPAWISFPITSGTLYGFLWWSFDRLLWRAKPELFGVRNLNGKWKAVGKSSFVDPATGQPFEFEMAVTIKQTFTKLEVFTETSDSTSRSSMASLCVDQAVATFRYAFDNTPRSLANAELQRHPGLIDLRVNSDTNMSGDYFSGKHRLRFGELKLERISS